MNNFEVYGISEAVLKIALTFAVAVIPSLLVLVAALRAGQGVVTAAKGVLKAIQQQIDTPEEQASVGALLKIPPEYVHEVEEFLKRLQGSSAPTPAGWQAVTVMETPPAAVGVAYVAPPPAEQVTVNISQEAPKA